MILSIIFSHGYYMYMYFFVTCFSTYKILQ